MRHANRWSSRKNRASELTVRQLRTESRDMGLVCRIPTSRLLASGDRIRRELHRPAAGRVPQRDAVRVAAAGPRRARCLARRLQPRAPTFRARQPNPGGVPNSAHRRCSQPPQRSKLQPRTLLLTGGKMGLRSTTEARRGNISFPLPLGLVSHRSLGIEFFMAGWRTGQDSNPRPPDS